MVNPFTEETPPVQRDSIERKTYDENLTDRKATAVLMSDLDQLTAGLARTDPKAIMKARQTLALLARDASPTLLRFIFDAFVTAWEGR